MFYDKGSYATWGNFPSVEWILVYIIITTNCTDNILRLVDSWYFKLSIDNHLWTVRPVVRDLSMLKTKCWWIFKLWHNYLCHKTWDIHTCCGRQCVHICYVRYSWSRVTGLWKSILWLIWLYSMASYAIPGIIHPLPYIIILSSHVLWQR